MMPLQRVWDAENQMRNKLSNGPRRVQSNVKFIFTEYSANLQSILQRVGIRQLPGICLYPAKSTEIP